MEEVFAVTLPLPPSTNHLYRDKKGRGGRAKSQEYRSWAQEAGLEVVVAKSRCGSFPEPPYRLSLDLYFKDHRIRDTSNFIKAVEDLIAQIVGYDDSWNYSIEVNKRFDKENPRVEVSLRHLEIPVLETA